MANATEFVTNAAEFEAKAIEIVVNATESATNATESVANATEIVANATEIVANATEFVTNATESVTNPATFEADATEFKAKTTEFSGFSPAMPSSRRNDLALSGATVYSDLMNSKPVNAESSRKKKAPSSSISSGRWAAYAAAGVASTVALAPSSEAEVHYSGIVNYNFAAHGGQGSFPLEPGVDIAFNVGVPQSAQDSFGHVMMRNVEGSGFVASPGIYTSPLASSLPARVNLSQQSFPVSCRFTSSFSTIVCYKVGANLGSGRFQTRGETFIGFYFNDASGLHYGWARLRLSGAPDYKFVLVDYAWADNGEDLLTGQKKSRHRAEATPKSGSLGLLALGGAGLRAWRAEK